MVGVLPSHGEINRALVIKCGIFFREIPRSPHLLLIFEMSD
jgi:hypothetical protein